MEPTGAYPHNPSSTEAYNLSTVIVFSDANKRPGVIDRKLLIASVLIMAVELF